MLEFLAQYGPYILAGLTAAGSAAVAVKALVECGKAIKNVKTEQTKTKEDIQITQEGIIEAFKTAKLPEEVRVNITNQVKTYLTNFRDEFIEMYKENEKLRNAMMVSILKILNFTAASNKLTEEEKQQINKLIEQLGLEEVTIDINE